LTSDHEYHGHVTMSDGSHVKLSCDEAKAILDSIERSQAERAERMPDTYAALSALCSAAERLKELGWHDSRYCPREGRFAVCEIGSTGIWSASRWDTYIHYGDSVSSPGSHMLWKALDKLDSAEKATMAECAKSDAEYIDRLGRSFGEAD
jgi:hypothetical protein